MLISGGVSAAAGVGSALIGGNAAKEAARTQVKAADKAAAAQEKRYGEIKGTLEPYMTAGLEGLEGVQDLLGLGDGQLGGQDIQSYLASLPGYQFVREQGLMATQNAYAAKGLGSSGAALKGAAEYSTGLADSTYQSQLNNFYSLANVGQNAATSLGQIGMQSQSEVNQLTTGGAAATAAGTVGAANATISGLGTVAGAVDNTSMMLALNKAGLFGTTSSGGQSAFSPGTWRSPSQWGNVV
jgi:hypothetical protein